MTIHRDAAFAKYSESGAYHWREIGTGWLSHNAFTAERYRAVIGRAALGAGQRVLDYGCGDGALIGMLRRRLRDQPLDIHGFDPNPLAVELARRELSSRGIPATIHASVDSLPSGSFDRVLCTEVIEHAVDPVGMLRTIAALLKPSGQLVITTPIRLTEAPEDPNHVQEWFPDEFARLFDGGVWRVLAHEQVVPAAAVEAYFWRPPVFARVPVFRLVCNALSMYADVNALSWLRVRPRLFMMQVVVASRV